MFAVKILQRSLSGSARVVLLASLLAGFLLAGILAAPRTEAQTTHPDSRWVSLGQSTQSSDKVLPEVSLSQPDPAYIGKETVLHGQINNKGKKVDGAAVYLDQKDGASWNYAMTAQADQSGAFTFKVKLDNDASYRAFTSETKVNYLGVSPELGVRVQPAPAAAPAPAAQGPSVASANSSVGQQIVDVASRYAGKPYVYGAAGPDAYDCSGLTLVVFKQFGISLPHSAEEQSHFGTAVSESQAQPGDLVFFGSPGAYHHVGIYAGNGQMWNAPNESEPVQKESIWSESHTLRRLI